MSKATTKQGIRDLNSGGQTNQRKIHVCKYTKRTEVNYDPEASYGGSGFVHEEKFMCECGSETRNPALLS